jgi:hypothetical protein
MTLQWVRLETSLPDHPKVLALIDGKKHKAVMAYVLGLAYCGRHELDGYIPKAALRFIHANKRDADALCDVGLWIPTATGYEINGWSDFQPTSEDRAKAKVKAKAAAYARWNKEDDYGLQTS